MLPTFQSVHSTVWGMLLYSTHFLGLGCVYNLNQTPKSMDCRMVYVRGRLAISLLLLSHIKSCVIFTPDPVVCA